MKKLLLLLLFTLVSNAEAQVGSFISLPNTTCANDTRITTPVKGETVCFDSVTNQWLEWSGSSWVSQLTSPTIITPMLTPNVGIGTGFSPASALEIKGTGGDASRERITATGVNNAAFLRMCSSDGTCYELTKDTDGTIYFRSLTDNNIKFLITSGGSVTLGALGSTGLSSTGDLGLANLKAYRMQDSGGTFRSGMQVDGSNNLDIGDVNLVPKFFPNNVLAWTMNTDGSLQSAGKAQTSLPASPNGSIIWCTDCNANCTTNGGTGIWCKRVGGAWVNF